MIWAAVAVLHTFAVWRLVRAVARRAYARGMITGCDSGIHTGVKMALEHMSRVHGNEVLTNLAREALADMNAAEGRKPN